MSEFFKIENLHASVGGKEILKGLSLTIAPGEIHALMGRNGSGKTTLSHVIMGHPKYQITQGRILYKGEDISTLKPYERAKKGLFLAFQYPTPIPGVTVSNFLRTALKAVRGQEVSIKDFRKELKEKMALLGIEESFAIRYVNDGFSGGEKKRLEMLQLGMLHPQMMIMDETDSGLDIDALKTVAQGFHTFKTPETGTLLITHYQRLLDYIKPSAVHVLMEGQIVRSGGPELAQELEAKGYDWLSSVPA